MDADGKSMTSGKKWDEVNEEYNIGILRELAAEKLSEFKKGGAVRKRKSLRWAAS